MPTRKTRAAHRRYDWRIVDGIFDAYLANGVRPFVELGFMPQALSTAPADAALQTFLASEAQWRLDRWRMGLAAA